MVFLNVRMPMFHALLNNSTVSMLLTVYSVSIQFVAYFTAIFQYLLLASENNHQVVLYNAIDILLKGTVPIFLFSLCFQAKPQL